MFTVKKINVWRVYLGFYFMLCVAFIDLLNEIRSGQLSVRATNLFTRLSRPLPEPKQGPSILPTRLFSMRHEVEQANNKALCELQGQERIFAASDHGKTPFWKEYLQRQTIAPDILKLKEGALVILIKNLDTTLVNGTRGKVMSFQVIEGRGNQEWPVVRFENGRQQVMVPEVWEFEIPGEGVVASRTQVPLLLSWAMSIHKSQGQTIQRCVVDLGKIFEKGQAYVALSRATSLEGLQVLNFRADTIKAHERVIEYYRQIQI